MILGSDHAAMRQHAAVLKRLRLGKNHMMSLVKAISPADSEYSRKTTPSRRFRGRLSVTLQLLSVTLR
jgi:hypothetical protein